MMFVLCACPYYIDTYNSYNKIALVFCCIYIIYIMMYPILNKKLIWKKFLFFWSFYVKRTSKLRYLC